MATDADGVERLYLPSRIRRGRAQATPTWRATRGGRPLYFRRKADAYRYLRDGCAQVDHQWTCRACGGRRDP